MTQELELALSKYIEDQRWKELNNANIEYCENCIEFEIKEYHLLLMKELSMFYAGFGDNGVVTSDSKRPYGNSDMEFDILAYISGKKQDDFTHGDGEIFPEFQNLLEANSEILRAIHVQMGLVINIVCATLSVELGVFRRTQMWTRDWKKV